MFNQVVQFVRIYAACHGEDVLIYFTLSKAVVFTVKRAGILSLTIFREFWGISAPTHFTWAAGAKCSWRLVQEFSHGEMLMKAQCGF